MMQPLAKYYLLAQRRDGTWAVLLEGIIVNAGEWEQARDRCPADGADLNTIRRVWEGSMDWADQQVIAAYEKQQQAEAAQWLKSNHT